MKYDPLNLIAVMVHICDTFGLTHEQAMALRTRVEKTFHAQPTVVRVSAAAPVTVNAIAIVYGLLIGFGGFQNAVKASPDRVIKLARAYDPYGDRDPALQKLMHKRALANRRGRR
jgi:hypothetical protein